MSRFASASLCLLLAMAIVSCSTPEEKSRASASEYFTSSATGIKTGGIQIIPIQTPKGEFKVWTKCFGNNARTKVLLLHGGPGATHEYWECMESFFPEEGIEFIYYDQLGSAYSDQPKDNDLWVTERFVDELEQVRTALGLNKDNFFLLGHSWGGILAIEYALKYQNNLKGLIISNMMSSAPDYGRYADEVLSKQMDPAVLKQIRVMEAKGDFGNPKYMELLMTHYYVQHILRLPIEQWPDPVVRAFNKINQDVYVLMQGPSEFGIAGRLAEWDRSKDLPKITVPTLVVGAQYDTMDPEHMKWMASQVEHGSYLYCSNGSHMCMYDDQETYMQGLIKFIKSVDAGNETVQFP
ncbi:MAG: alpha/beta fold hydrolase [Ignavibacteria bacterium]|nr:alpha/beta fold hydrolase [Ignavibacteria bacterium]